MSDTDELLGRQAAWQKQRSALPWPEKIRMAEAVRESVVHLRSGAARQPPNLDQPGSPRMTDTESEE